MLIFYISGIILQKNIIFLKPQSIFLFCLIALSLCLVTSYNKRNLTGIFLLLCFLSLGMLNTSYQSQPQGSNHVYRFLNRSGVLTGIIEKSEYNSDGQYLEILLSTRYFKEGNTTNNSNGKVLLKVYGEDSTLGYGDLVDIRVVLQEPALPNNFGEFNYREYLIRQKIFVTGSTTIDQITSISRKKQLSLPYFLNYLRNKIENNIDNLFSYPCNTLIKAIITGNRRGIPSQWELIFQDAGIMHILAISGLHVGIIAAALFFIFRLIPFFRGRRSWSHIIIIVFLLGYAAIAGFRPSVSRATLMFSAMLIAGSINRPYHLSNSLYLSALILLFYQPLLLFDAGFLLSFTVTFFIVFLKPIIEERIDGFLPSYISQPLAVSAAAWLGVAPLSAYFFYKISYIALLSNLIIVPLISTILILGIISVFFSFIFLPCAGVFAIINRVFIKLLIFITRLSTSLPFAFQYIAQPKMFQILFYYFFLILLSLTIAYWTRINIEIKKILFWAITASLLLFLIIPSIFSLNTLSVHFINVGQGDSILIQTPEKRNILIDGGGIPYSDFDIGKKVVLPYLRRLGVGSIDMMVLTHPDLDHLKGLVSVLKEMRVNMVIDSGIDAQSTAYNEFLSLIGRDGSIFYYKPERGDTIRLAPDLEIMVLNSLNLLTYGNESNFNNHSIVLKLLYKNTSFLFTGDIEEKAEISLLNWDNLLKSDILKVAHHGSLTSSTDCFIEKVQPEVAVISVGLNNFNHPHQDILERLDGCCQRVFRTDCNGTVLINSNGQKYNIKTLR